MKKILFIIEGLYGGGAEKALVELLSNFDYKQYEVTLCVVYYGGVYMDQIPAPVKVIYLYDEKRGYWRDSFKRKSFRFFRKYTSTLLMRRAISSQVKEQNFDVIVSFLEGTSLLFHTLIRHRAKRNVTWVHCDLPNHHWTSHLFKKPGYEESCYAAMDEIVFVSQNSMNAFNGLFKVDVPKTCIYNVIDRNEIGRMAQIKKVEHVGFTIIAIGSLVDVKRFDRLIRVAKMFKDRHYQLSFQILGVGEREEELRALCTALQVDDCVSFLGFQKPPYPYLAVADVLVSTSLSEGLPFVICEALVLGVPVVATRTAGAIELLDEGKYGLLTEHDDVSIFEGLKEMIDNQDLRKEFKLKSKERALDFDVKQTMDKIYHLIES